MKIRLFRTPVILPLLLLSIGIGIGGCQQASKKPATESAFLLPEAAEISGFNLTHTDRGDFDIDDTRGRWSLLFFGYTQCPDVCPTELFMLSEMMRGIEKNPEAIDKTPQVVFVSVDPQRDSLQHLQEYAAFYHPGFIGVTSEQATIDQLCESMGVFYERVYYYNGRELIFDASEGVPAGLENSYLINHSASIFLVNPDGKLHAIFTSPHDPSAITRDLTAIQASWRS